MLRALARDHLEILMETRKIGKPAFKAQLLYTDPVIDQQLARMSHPYLRNKLRIRLAGAGLEISAERIRHQPCHCRHLLQVDLLWEMTEGVIINSIDPLVLHFGEIMPETNGRKQMHIRSGSKCRKALDKRNDPPHTFAAPDLLHEDSYLTLLPGADLQSPPGLIQQIPNGLRFRQL